LIILNFLELPLVVSKELCVVEVDHILVFLLCHLDVVVVAPIRLEGPLQALHDAVLRVDAVLIELPPVVIFGVLAVVPHVLHRLLPVRLLVIHILNELLPALQVSNTLVGALLLFLKFHDSVLDLRLLVLLLLGDNDCVHHYVLRLLRVYGAHAGSQVLVLLLDWWRH